MRTANDAKESWKQNRVSARCDVPYLSDDLKNWLSRTEDSLLCRYVKVRGIPLNLVSYSFFFIPFYFYGTNTNSMRRAMHDRGKGILKSRFYQLQ